MADPFLGELRLASFTLVPRGWARCDGQLLPINQNQALFSLLGTTYGGDGRVNFALPDLRGSRVIGSGGSYAMGQRGGSEFVTLTGPQAIEQMVTAADETTNRGASGSALARGGAYTDAPLFETGAVGAGQPHENRPPYLVLQWIIALQGIFPSQN